MFGFSQRRNGISEAVGAVIEELEQRRLLSASASAYLDGLRSHTLTASQMEANNLVSMNWQGHDIYSKGGQWIVGFKRNAPTYDRDGNLVSLNVDWAGPNVKAPNLQGAFDEAGQGLRFVQYLGSKDFALIDAPQALSFTALQDSLTGLDRFSFVEPNEVFAGVDATPNDAKFASQYSLNNTGQTGGTVDADIDAPEAWNLTQGWSGAVVGELDTGIDYTHADLSANIWTNPNETAGNGIDDDANGYVDDVHGYDFVNNDSNPTDDNGHGTHVAGTIAAVGNNSVGVSGVAWNARVMAIKVLDASGAGSFSADVSGIEYATMMHDGGVNIRATNNSYGGGTFDQGVHDAIQLSGTSGMLFIAAAGNGGSDHIGDDDDLTPHYPASYDLDNVIAVTATDANDSLASFSNYGSDSVDIGAPGVNILSTFPLSLDTADGNQDGYAVLSGTSMATPHVTGAAALAFSVYPDATYQQIRDAIFNGADAKSSLSGKTVTGKRLNAYGALNQLNPSSITLSGDVNGRLTADTILLMKDPNNSSYLQGLVNGVQQWDVPLAGLSSVAVNSIGANDDVIIDSAVTLPVHVECGTGDDSVSSGSGADSIVGGIGDDTVQGNDGNDTIIGADGDDRLNGESGHDLISGGRGNDTLNGGSSGDYLSGGEGTSDMVDYSDVLGGNNLIVTLDDNLANDGIGGSAEGDTIESTVENVVGGGGDDVIYGSAVNNLLVGGTGNDYLDGKDGNDTLSGAGGNDTLIGSSGTDSLTGDSGNDIFYLADSFGNHDTAWGGSGTDSLGSSDSDDIFNQ